VNSIVTVFLAWSLAVGSDCSLQFPNGGGAPEQIFVNNAQAIEMAHLLCGDSTSIADYLHENGLPEAVTGTSGYTLLHWAVAAGRPGIVDELLREAPSLDVNARLISGRTPLGVAVPRGDVDMLRVLLAHGADPNIGSDSNLPIVDAVGGGDQELVALLLEYGADPNQQFEGISGGTPPAWVQVLSPAKPSIARTLVTHGVRVDPCASLDYLSRAPNVWNSDYQGLLDLVRGIARDSGVECDCDS
jgi:uncharacterized protein